jgi:hypothetical protein
MNKQINEFPVFNKQIADTLILKGFKLTNILPNRKFPRYSVFYFEKTKEFDAAFYEENVLHNAKINNLINY